jgi:hypothetical protein
MRPTTLTIEMVHAGLIDPRPVQRHMSLAVYVMAGGRLTSLEH